MEENRTTENSGDILLQLSPYFPLKDNKSILELFADQLNSCEPNLAALSLICGYFEHHLTCKSRILSNSLNDAFPVLDFNCFYQIYERYLDLIRKNSTLFDLILLKSSSQNGPCEEGDIEGHAKRNECCNIDEGRESFTSVTSRRTIKNISDFVWGQLSTSFFKDRPHIQNLYSFLYGKRLDCLGVALTIVMTAQHIGLNDVHLSLSEDHAWVIFGRNGEENAEVTWHGRRDEIKRGNPIGENSLVPISKDWLYLGGNGMKCDRKMEVAAIVSSMNPAVDSMTESQFLGRLQQDLLWYLFDQGILDRYPMAICNLADLEEIEPSRESPSISELYEKAIHIAKVEYSDYHVYPYTYYGGYLQRERKFSDATKQWRSAAMVAARYTHSREDEELYKDLNEVANTFLPQVLKNYKLEIFSSLSLGLENGFFNSMQNLINIIKFYDGVCLWEEGSTSAVIHSEWAKNFSKILSLFPQDMRANCKFLCAEIVVPSEEQSPGNNLKSKKMNLVLDLIADAKIKSQIVDLHLTSQVALESKSVDKRPNNTELRKTARSKRYKLSM